MENETFKNKIVKISLVVSSYWVVSISLVFLNKWLLSYNELEIPTFITWFQCVMSIIFVFFLSFLFGNSCSGVIPKFTINSIDFINVMLLSVIFSAMIVFNNYTLKLVPVSFYNVARSLTTFFNMVFTITILKKPICLKSILCCVLVISGFIIGVEDSFSSTKQQFSLILIMGIGSSVFVSLYAIFMKSSLEMFGNNISKLQFALSIDSSVILFPLLILLGDHSSMINDTSSANSSITFWISLVVSGFFGYLIGVCTLLQIKYTSPLTHNISGTAKSCIQTVLAVIILKESHTFNWWLGNFLVLIGSALYSYVKTCNMKAEDKLIQL